MLSQKQKQAIRSEKHKAKLMSTKEGHIKYLYAALKYRTKKRGIELNVDVDYLITIASDTCPIFGIELSWCQRKGKVTQNSPSLDRIDPTKGYVVDNLQWISNLANAMKQNASSKQLHQFANWIKTNIPEK